MDIVSRIKSFIKAQNLSVSQFADTCLIPRPTVSQLLNGRNKKVSDEIISKIHTAYPSLSIIWLLFGEGEMYSNNSTGFDMTDKNGENDENLISMDDESNDIKNQNLNKVEEQSIFDSTTSKAKAYEGIDVAQMLNGASNLQMMKGEGRKVVNIIVFYSDNSFEYFKPNEK